jgi:hypothetical protein
MDFNSKVSSVTVDKPKLRYLLRVLMQRFNYYKKIVPLWENNTRGLRKLTSVKHHLVRLLKDMCVCV